MIQRPLRVAKWPSTNPAIGAYTLCGWEFVVPTGALKRTADARARLQEQFDGSANQKITLASTSRRSQMRRAISLFVIWIIVTPVPVDGLLPSTQLNERPLLVVLGLIALIRAVFIGVPVVIVLVAPVVVTLVVLALTIFVVPIVLRDGNGHHRNGCRKGSGQKK
jgi:hypothetical protein